MSSFNNVLAQLRRRKQEAIDTPPFTYAYRVLVPNYAAHVRQNFPWPGSTPGLARLRFRIEEDAHFKITSVTGSVYGPAQWVDGTKEEDQVMLPAPNGATIFPLPGFKDPRPQDVRTVTFSAAADECTPAVGGGPYRNGQPVMFKQGANGVLPAELAYNKLYYIKAANPVSVFGLSLTPGGALITLSTDGSGTNYACLPDVIVSVVGDTITVSGAHNVLGQFDHFRDGQPVTLEARYADGSIAPDSELPQPFVRGREYYLTNSVVGVGSASFSLSATPNGPAITITSDAPTAGTDRFVWFKDGVAERGVSVRISDTAKNDRKLVNDFCPIELLLQPGYGTHVPGVGTDVQSLLSGYVLPKQHELLLEFQNRDTAGLALTDVSDEVPPTEALDLYHVVHIAFTGILFYDK